MEKKTEITIEGILASYLGYMEKKIETTIE